MSKRFFAVIIFVLMMAGGPFANAALPELLLPDDTVNSGGTVTVPVVLDGAGGICALQFALYLPQGIVPATGTDGVEPITFGELCLDHELSYNWADGELRVACLSMTNSAFQYESGVVCYITLMADSVSTSVNKTILVTDVELTTTDVRSIRLDDSYCDITVNLPEITPDVSFSLSPVKITGSIESSIVIESAVDISSIAFNITVPEAFAQNKLISLFSHLVVSDFNTEISQTDECSFDVVITALGDNVIKAGKTEIAGIAINYMMGLLVPDVYVFSLDNIVITTPDGKAYGLAPVEYRMDLTSTQVRVLTDDSFDEPVAYYSLDGRQVTEPLPGITLVRHADGRVTKLIKR